MPQRKTDGDLLFSLDGGLWGGDEQRVDYTAFLGVGGDAPVTTQFQLGGGVEIWLPFKGKTEVLRAQINGDIAARFGVELGASISLGSIDTDLSFGEVSYRWDDGLAPSDTFRLAGTGGDFVGDASDFVTEFPNFRFYADVIFDVSTLLTTTLGVFGNNKTTPLFGFDVDWRLPLLELDSNPDRAADDEFTILGLTTAALDSLGVDIPTTDGLFKPRLEFEFGAQTLSSDDFADDDDTKRSSEDTAKQDDDPEERVEIGAEITFGPIGTFLLQFPSIDLPSLGELRAIPVADADSDGDVSRDDPDDDYEDLRELNVSADNYAGDPWSDGVLAKQGSDVIAGLNIDLDNLLYRVLSPFVPLIPFELSGGFSASVKGFSLGLDFEYNLLDVDLDLTLPLVQNIAVDPEPLKTRLSFFELAEDGETPTDDAFFATVRQPRYSVYYNENGTFRDDALAGKLQALVADAADPETQGRIARDLSLFVDFDTGLPGAFTGQSGSIAGRVVTQGRYLPASLRDGAGPNDYVPLTTFPERTYWIARTLPSPGSEPDLDDLKDRVAGQDFWYEVVDTDGTVLIRHRIDVRDLIGARDTIFETRLESIEAPIAATDLLEGVPSLDLVFDSDFFVSVDHLSVASVANLTRLDVELDLTLTALELALEAYAEVLGQRVGLGFDIGPLFERSFPIAGGPIATLFDRTFELSQNRFETAGAPGILAEDWGFAIKGSSDSLVSDGINAILDATDTAQVPATGAVDGGDGTDTLTYQNALTNPANPVSVTAVLGGLAVWSRDDGVTQSNTLVNIENLAGSRGDDMLTGDDDDNRLLGLNGDDALTGLGGDDTLIGAVGEDTLDGGDGNDILLGGDGNDLLLVSAGLDVIDGGEEAVLGTLDIAQEDLDLLDFRNLPVALSLNLTTRDITAHDWLAGDTWISIEGYRLTDMADSFTGSAGRDYVEGRDGDDLLEGEHVDPDATRAARQELDGDIDRLYGGDGDDTLRGGPGADMLDGGAGIDLADYSRAPTSVFVDMQAPIEFTGAEIALYAPLNAGLSGADFFRIDGQGWRGWAQGDKLRDIENLTGTDHDDILFGDAGDNVIAGGKGNDRLTGRDGFDTLRGGDGNDLLWRGDLAQGGAVSGGRFFVEGFLAYEAFNLTALDAAGANDNHFDGGAGDDIVIAESGLTVTFTDTVRLRWTDSFRDNPLTIGFNEAAVDARENRIDDLEVRYSATLDTSVEGSLTDGYMDILVRGGDIPLRIAAIRDPGGTWDEFDAPLTPSTAFDQDFLVSRGFLPTRFDRGDFPFSFVSGTRFPDADSLSVQRAADRIGVSDVHLSTDTLTDIEGLIGDRSDDILVGSDDPGALYSGGGADMIAAGGGDDTLGGGAGQSAFALFSFPGRTLTDPEAGIAGASGTGAGGIILPGETTSDVSATDRYGFELDLAYADTARPTGVEAVLRAYLAEDGLPSVDRLRALRADLTDPDLVDAVTDTTAPVHTGGSRTPVSVLMQDIGVFDGGADRDVLDLRFDRGLDFFPQPGDIGKGAFVALESQGAIVDRAASGRFTTVNTDLGTGQLQTFGFLNWLEPATPPFIFPPFLTSDENPAILLNVEDVIGTAGNDYIRGDAGDNVIEGGPGSDTLLGGDGRDVLSYALAQSGVTMVFGINPARAEASARLLGGDARNDKVGGFEILRGSDHADLLGVNGWDGLNAFPVLGPFTFGLIDAGGGDDELIADREGVAFLGGDGDDRFYMGDGVLASAGAETVDAVVLEGGAGVDHAFLPLPGVDQSVAFAWEGDSLRITQSFVTAAPPFTPDGAGQIDRLLTGIEFLTFTGDAPVTFRLDNTDPVLTPDRVLDLPEDPWRPFNVTIPDRAFFSAEGHGIAVVVASVPQPAQGIVLVLKDGDADFTMVVPGMQIRKSEAETLVFVPGQGFAVPADLGRGAPLDLSADADLTKALIEGLDETAVETAPTLLGATLGLTIFEEVGADLPPKLRALDVDIAPQDLDGVELGLSAPVDTRADAISVALGRFVEGGSTLVFGTGDAPDLMDRLPESNAGPAQPFELVAGIDGAVLRYSDAGTGLPRDLVVGGQITRAELGTLELEAAGGFLTDAAELAFQPVESLKVTVTGTPARGKVFDPTVAIPITAPDGPLGADQTYTIDAVPVDGTLFYRPEPGLRVTVNAGDRLTAAQLEGLFFTADPGRTAIGPIDDDPFRDPGFLKVRFSVDDKPQPEITGFAIDMDSAGITRAGTDAPLQAAIGSFADVEWTQWRTEDGGNGHVYGAVVAGSIDWNEARGWAALLAEQGGGLASIGDAAENAFVLDLFLDRPGAFRAFGDTIGAGILLGAEQQSGSTEPDTGFEWLDGTPWDFSAWAGGEPNDGGGAAFPREAVVEMWRVTAPDQVDGDPTIYLPQWNDTTRTALRDAFAIEAAGIVSDDNDLIRGSTRRLDADGVVIATGNDRIDGADGDDMIFGRSGDDTIDGGDGDDRIAAGPGDDTVAGGAGADTFAVSRDDGRVRIVDFEDGVDRIDLTGLAVERFADFTVRWGALDGGGRGTLLSAFGTDIELVDVFAFDRDAGRDMLWGIDGDRPDGRTPVVSDPGDDTVTGTDAGERFTLRDGQVVTTGGGADIVNLVAGGTIRVTDFDRGTDLLYLDDFGASLVNSVSAETDETGTTIVHGDATVILDGVFLTGWRSEMAATSRLDGSDFVGISLLGATAMPTFRDLAVADGDSILTDDLDHLRYRAPQDGTGDDGAFSYAVRDPWAVDSPLDPRIADRDGVAAGSVGFDLAAINDAPRGLDSAYVVAHDVPFAATSTDLKLAATDPEGDPVTFSLFDDARFGAVTVDADGGFVYTPDPDILPAMLAALRDAAIAAGEDPDAVTPPTQYTDTFTYLRSDGAAASLGTVSLTVTAKTAARAVGPDTEMDDGFRLIFGLTARDALTGSDAPDRLLGFAGPDILRGEGDDDDLDGGDDDDDVAGGPGADRITLGAGADTARGTPGDLDGDTITDFTEEDVIVVTGASLGPEDVTFDIGAAGATISMVPPGHAPAAIRLDGGYGGKALALSPAGPDTEIRLVDAPVNRAPVARDDSYDVTEDVPTVLPFLSNDTDPDGDALSAVIVDGPAHGRLAPDGGAWIYSPDADYAGPDAFDYRVDDGADRSGIATVAITVTPVDDAPLFAAAGPFTVAENTRQVGTVTATDIDSGGLRFAIADGGDGALFAIDAARGLLSFRAPPDFETPQDAGGDNVHDLFVSVSDAAQTVTAPVRVVVTDLDDTLTPVIGSDRNDRLTGTRDDDRIDPMGGRLDVMTGFGGDDVFDFASSTTNGIREVRRITDFSDGDTLDLGAGVSVWRSVQTSRDTILYLDGDRDVVILQGVWGFDADAIL